jgi:hypothetical protein
MMKEMQNFKRFKIVFIISALHLLLFVLSCSLALAAPTFSMKDKDGNQVVDVFLDANTAIQAGKIQINGKMKDSDTIKYSLAGAVNVIKVKLKENGFKLKDENKLLWKAKFKNEKILVSDNDENEKPCIVKREAPEIFRVYEDQKLVGTVNYSSFGTIITASRMTNPATWRVSQSGITAAGGIVLCEKIPDIEKFIIMAELIRAGK